MSVIFKCAKHNFDCENPSEWREHLAKMEHARRGVAPCSQCAISNEFVFTGKIGDNEPSLCESCRDKLLEGGHITKKKGDLVE